jgi:hypothetical protein
MTPTIKNERSPNSELIRPTLDENRNITAMHGRKAAPVANGLKCLAWIEKNGTM